MKILYALFAAAILALGVLHMATTFRLSSSPVAKVWFFGAGNGSRPWRSLELPESTIWSYRFRPARCMHRYEPPHGLFRQHRWTRHRRKRHGASRNADRADFCSRPFGSALC